MVDHDAILSYAGQYPLVKAVTAQKQSRIEQPDCGETRCYADLRTSTCSARSPYVVPPQPTSPLLINAEIQVGMSITLNFGSRVARLFSCC